MLAAGALVLLLGAGVFQASGDSSTPRTSAAVSDTAVARAVPVDTALLRAPIDTPPPRKRPKVIEVSEWYSRRLAIHQVVSYATIPVFALQYVAGNQLYTKGSSAPAWAKTMHRVGATSLAAMFTVNTVTGVWNWWDSRSAPQGRILRTLHAVSMLTADAAFTYAGAKLSNEAETDGSKRTLHRKIAIGSIGLTAVSGLAMKIWNR